MQIGVVRNPDSRIHSRPVISPFPFSRCVPAKSGCPIDSSACGRIAVTPVRIGPLPRSRAPSPAISVSVATRTPLTSLTGALGLTVGGALGELNASQQRMLQLAQSHCQHLSQLVNTLLDVEKLASGNMPFQLAPHAVAPLLQEVIAECQAMAQQSQSQIQLQVPANLQQTMVLADQARLKQVLSHLLSNALKFSPANSLVTVQLAQSQQSVRISVLDQGKGVVADFVPRLFSRFSQENSSDSREHGGSGLGLAVSRNLMQHMHGDIGYAPGPERGSCFYVELPFDSTIQSLKLP